MQPPHIGDVLQPLSPPRVPHNVRGAEHHGDERHGLPGISQHKNWQPTVGGSNYKYSIHPTSSTRCQFFSNPCTRR